MDAFELRESVHSPVLRLDLVSPMCTGRREPLDVAWLAEAMVRRVRAVERAMGVPPERRWDRLSELTGRWGELEFVRQRAWSVVQERWVDLSGWIGVLFLSGPVEEHLDLFSAAEVLQVGRHTNSGCGMVRVGAAHQDAE